MTSYFIYYRLAPSHAADITQTAGAIFRLVHAAAGIAGRLMRRDDDSNTWMEVYENVADAAAFEAALAQAVNKTRFDNMLAAGSTRQIERFTEATR
jgi:Domain of unknown function (DUF4936)